MTQSLETFSKVARQSRVVPVLVLPDASKAERLAEVLGGNGLKVLEVTLRTPAGLASIEAMKRVSGDLIVGAGTVLTPEDARRAIDAGADFLVSPGLTPALLAGLNDAQPIMIPGVATASEAMMRQEEGFTLLKLFPAVAAGGLNALKGLAGPLPELRFMPTGGISEQNAADYLAQPNVVAVGGSWIVSADDLKEGQWDKIAAKAQQASRL